MICSEGIYTQAEKTNLFLLLKVPESTALGNSTQKEGREGGRVDVI